MAARLTSSVHSDPTPSGLASSLPLTPFEEYMLLDDTDEYPMCFHNWCRLVGPLDRDALDAALADVQVRHPLLRMRVVRESGKWQWVPTDHAPTSIVWAKHGESQAPLLPRIDLTQRSGLYAAGIAQGDVADICLQMHHSCTDGIGSVQFLRDWLLAYAARCEGKPPDVYWPPLDAGRLPLRSKLRLAWFRWPGFLARQSVGLLGVRQFLARRPVPLAPALDQAPRHAGPAYLSRTLDPAPSAALLEQARAAGVTLNERVLRDLILVLHQWRHERGYAQPVDWLRIATPMNLRGPDDLVVPAANIVSLVFLDAQPADCANPAALLRNMHRDMQQIKDLSLGWTFIASVAFARLFPGHIEQSLRQKRCQSTAIFSNFGRLLEDWPLARDQGRVVCGNVVLESMDFVAVLRPLTNFGIVAHSYANRLRITAPYDPRVLTEADANLLLDRLVDRLQATSAQSAAA